MWCRACKGCFRRCALELKISADAWDRSQHGCGLCDSCQGCVMNHRTCVRLYTTTTATTTFTTTTPPPHPKTTKTNGHRQIPRCQSTPSVCAMCGTWDNCECVGIGWHARAMPTDTRHFLGMPSAPKCCTTSWRSLPNVGSLTYPSLFGSVSVGAWSPRQCLVVREVCMDLSGIRKSSVAVLGVRAATSRIRSIMLACR